MGRAALIGKQSKQRAHQHRVLFNILTSTHTFLYGIRKTLITFIDEHVKYFLERWNISRDFFKLRLDKVFIFVPL